MAGIFDWLGGRRSSGRDQDAGAAATAPNNPYAELSARLGDYPPDTPLHRGDPGTLSPGQRAENFTQFLARDADRVAILGSWLWRQGFDISLVFKGDEAALAEGRRIDEWLAGWVPKRAFDTVRGDPDINSPVERWFASDRAGVDLVFSFISDLSRLNAAAICAANPLFAWRTVDDELDRAIRSGPEDDGRDEPSSERGRICLVRDLYDGSTPIVLDVPVAVLHLVHKRMSPLGHPVQDRFPIWLEAIRDGAFRYEERDPPD
jgi:hypothetical protein